MNIQEIDKLMDIGAHQQVVQQLQARPLKALNDDEFQSLLICLVELNELDQAAGMLSYASETLASRSQFQSAVANLRLQMGDLNGAISVLQQLKDRNPSDSDVDFNLGLIFEQSGDIESATHCYQSALIKNPYHGEAYLSLGNICFDQGDITGAAEFYKFAYLRTGLPESAINYAVLLVNEGKLSDAKALVEGAVKRYPEHPALKELYLKLLIGVDQLSPDEAEAVVNRLTRREGNERIELVEEAVRNRLAFDRVITLEPFSKSDDRHQAKLCFAAGEIALKELADLELARRYYEQGVTYCREEASNYAGLALVSLWKFDFDEMVRIYEKGWEYTKSKQLLENYIFNMHNHPNEEIEKVVSICKCYADHFLIPYISSDEEELRRWKRKEVLRIGFLSEGFNGHPVGYMGLPFIKELFGRGVEVYLYSSTQTFDAINAQFKAHATQYLDVRQMSDESLLNQVRSDELDVFFDLAGHSNGSRLSVVAARVAPLQVKWVGGIISSTQCPNMDLLIGDRWETPEHLHKYYSEEVVMMPDSYLNFHPSVETPDLVIKEKGGVVFGSFNRLDKLSPRLVEVWSKILDRVEGSRMLIKGKNASDPSVCQRVIGLFSRFEIEEWRLEFRGGTSQFSHLQAYNEIDIHLDTFPYSGCLTTLEALLMGVPVVTVAGELFSSRHGLTHLCNTGFCDWVAEDQEEYVEKVVKIANEIDDWRGRRAWIRERLLSSALADEKKFADHLLRELVLRLEQLEDQPFIQVEGEPE